jgi:hypothetical protein
MSLSNAPTIIEDTGINLDESMAIQKFGDVVASIMNEAQYRILCGRTPKKYIKTRPGKGKKTFSYVPHGYVVGVLNKAFGFNWDVETLPWGDGNYYRYIPPKYGPDRDGKEVKYHNGSYLVQVKLTLRIMKLREANDPDSGFELVATIVKTATGEKEELRGMTPGGHVKSAESDGLKKTATRLGVALDLYWQDADEDYMPATEPPQSQAEFIVRLPELGKTHQQAMAMLGKTLPEIDPARDFIKLRNMIKGA